MPNSKYEWAWLGVPIGLWLSLHPLYQALLILQGADILTGIGAVLATGGQFTSNVSFRGGVKKCMALLMVAVAAYLEPLAGGIPLGPMVAGYWCSHELLSVFENYARAGMPVPDQLKSMLEKLNPDAVRPKGDEQVPK